MIVEAEPILLAHASPMRKGAGFNDDLAAATQITGAKARHTMSLAIKAERRAEVKIRTNW